MNKKYYTILIILILAGLLAGSYYLNSKKPLNENPSSVVVDTSSVTSHVITKQDYNGVELRPEIKKIQNEILSLLITKYPENKEYYSNLSLKGISKDFAVITVNRPTGSGSLDELVNLKTGETVGLGSSASSVSLAKGFLYIENNRINHYSLGSKNSVVLEGSVLSKNNETYNSGGDMKITPVETHTDSLISITVFDSSAISQGEGTADYKFKKLRTESISFPK